ncbi:MAG: hypothetical protein EXQ88_03025 [Alphaproteobacteria bacterium]|nr:hypothetical protein [Alphaproteobacteria bacterium]
MTLAVLLRGGDPRRGVSDDAFLDKRIADGSYEALLHGLNLHVRLVPMLRGLLEDNALTRWTVNDLGRFLDVGTVTSPQHPKLRRATLPYSFNGKTHFTPVPLARALAQNWAAGLEAVQSDDLYDWMARGLVESKRMEVVKRQDKYGSAARHGRAGSADVDLARAIMLLDPDGPIRLREFSAHPDGLACALADSMTKQTQARDGALILQAQLVEFWAKQQKQALGSNVLELLVNQPRLASYAQRPGIGFGPDRCAYDLNADLACQSPLLGSGAVFDGPGLLQSLNARASADGEIFDHHIAAFLGARIGNQADRLLTDLAAASGDRAALMLARLRLFAAANTSAGVDLSQFCRQVVARMGSVVESFHNRSFRQKLSRALDEAAATGKIATVIALADNPSFVTADRDGFSQARAEHQAITGALTVLKQAVEERLQRAEALGHSWAATVSSLFAAVAAAALFIVYM